MGGKGFCAGTSVVCFCKMEWTDRKIMWTYKICGDGSGRKSVSTLQALFSVGRSHDSCHSTDYSKRKTAELSSLWSNGKKYRQRGGRDDGLSPCFVWKEIFGYKKCVDDNSGEWNVSGCFLYTAANGAETGFTSVWRSEPVSGYRNVFK